MSWIQDELDKFKHEARQASLEMEAMRVGVECYFCNKKAITNNTFQGHIICKDCNRKLADRVKLILKFE